MCTQIWNLLLYLDTYLNMEDLTTASPTDWVMGRRVPPITELSTAATAVQSSVIGWTLQPIAQSCQ